jgi:hypothetical protein
LEQLNKLFEHKIGGKKVHVVGNELEKGSAANGTARLAKSKILTETIATK